jgi:phytoene synthase
VSLLAEDHADPTLAEARATTKRVARTFALAARLLPREVRDDVYRLYLVFRTLDDLVDDGEPDALCRVVAVEEWCRGGAPRTPETRLLAGLDVRHGLPRDALLDFCAGMRHDLDGALVLTEEDLETYCYRVAGTVGITMGALLGTRPGVDARPSAAALGKAMQRTNVLRDIDEDWENGRVYLARETLERFGFLDGAPPPPAAREELLREQIARADALYEEGIAGISLLLSGRVAIRAAAAMYREILRQIEREGYGRRAGRIVVPRSRKILVAARSVSA